MNSLLDEEPEPSAMLFDIDIPAALSCSANRNNFFFSRSSAMSKRSFAILMADCQILKSWNLNLIIRFALCAWRLAIWAHQAAPQG